MHVGMNRSRHKPSILHVGIKNKINTCGGLYNYPHKCIIPTVNRGILKNKPHESCHVSYAFVHSIYLFILTNVGHSYKFSK